MSRLLLAFPPFRLDVDDGRLWKGPTEVTLRRKPFAILCYLAARPQRLVTQDELVREVWGNIVVSETAIRTQLYDLRQALGPGLIETVIGRGYRFRPAVTQETDVSRDASGRVGPSLMPPFAPAVRAAGSVGRNAELGALAQAHARAAAGERQMVFITGDPGIGKTTLVDAFLPELPASQTLVVHGHCVEQNGHGEPYLPLLQGLRRLCESSDGATAKAILSRRAPTWSLQMPGLFPDAELATLQQRTAGATQDRMLRELCEALESFSVERTAVIILEDLQWSDSVDHQRHLDAGLAPGARALAGDRDGSPVGPFTTRASAQHDLSGAAGPRARAGHHPRGSVGGRDFPLLAAAIQRTRIS